MNDIFKNINTYTKCKQFANNFEKSGFLQYSYFFLFKQSEIQPISNIACPGRLFIPLPILGGWWLDQLPYRGHFKLIAAI